LIKYVLELASKGAIIHLSYPRGIFGYLGKYLLTPIRLNNSVKFQYSRASII